MKVSSFLLHPTRRQKEWIYPQLRNKLDNKANPNVTNIILGLDLTSIKITVDLITYNPAPVVRKPINANPGLRINRSFHLACWEGFVNQILRLT